MITTKQLILKYGKPNVTGAGYLVTIHLPYPMRLAWDKKVIIKEWFATALTPEQKTELESLI